MQRVGYEDIDTRSEISFYRDARQLYQAVKHLLETEIDRAGTGGYSLVCVYLDIDHFWAMMASHPPEYGQVLLEEVLELLQEVPQTDQVASCGRDEFIVLARDRSIEDALIAAEQIRGRVETLVTSRSTNGGTGERPVGCSAGVAIFPEHADDAVDLLRSAEESLYFAKQEGRGRTKLPRQRNMILKSNYYTPAQCQRLRTLAKKSGRTEASILREALDMILREYDA